jgi:hypothetical protein
VDYKGTVMPLPSAQLPGMVGLTSCRDGRVLIVGYDCTMGTLPPTIVVFLITTATRYGKAY